MCNVQCTMIEGVIRVFQNISSEDVISEAQEVRIENKEKTIQRIRELFSIQHIVLYSIACMASMVSFNGNLAPFGLAIFAAVCGNRTAARSSLYSLFNWDINRVW